mmetsp:Transcript_3024/g.5947  ORF Transcript_3024/g.5947 Transcript_3024/m.5947 type:complete len:261 (+) Transcript_3024:470-1252(+)
MRGLAAALRGHGTHSPRVHQEGTARRHRNQELAEGVPAVVAAPSGVAGQLVARAYGQHSQRHGGGEHAAALARARHQGRDPRHRAVASRRHHPHPALPQVLTQRGVQSGVQRGGRLADQVRGGHPLRALQLAQHQPAPARAARGVHHHNDVRPLEPVPLLPSVAGRIHHLLLAREAAARLEGRGHDVAARPVGRRPGGLGGWRRTLHGAHVGFYAIHCGVRRSWSFQSSCDTCTSIRIHSSGVHLVLRVVQQMRRETVAL